MHLRVDLYCNYAIPRFDRRGTLFHEMHLIDTFTIEIKGKQENKQG